MTDNARKALEFIKNNNDAMERFKKVKSIEEVIILSKEYGFDITEEDLNITQEKKEILEGKKKLDITELEKVSGAGTACVCIIGGRGSGTVDKNGLYDPGDSFTCSCALGGGGESTNYTFCVCIIGGGGRDDVIVVSAC